MIEIEFSSKFSEDNGLVVNRGNGEGNDLRCGISLIVSYGNGEGITAMKVS